MPLRAQSLRDSVGLTTLFSLTSHEVAFAEQHSNNYYVYRVYDFDQATNAGKLYVRRGAIEAAF